MIQIESINIEQFRGIKQLELMPAGKRFGIFGPNGTGKSGVVDAIEFALTGSISRLTGAGSDELTVGKHGPHVDAGANSDKACVTIKGILTASGQKLTIQRSVAKPRQPKIEPANDETRAAVQELERHPEFALSRRDIVKYIITPAGKRDEDVKTLLRLDRLDAIRKSLTTVSNRANSEKDATATKAQNARNHFASGLGIENTKAKTILAAVNKHRKTLELKEIAELKGDTNFKEGMKEGSAKTHAIPKDLALKESQLLLDAMRSELGALLEARTNAATSLKDLQSDAEAWRAVRQDVLVRTGLPLIDDDGCPLCDKHWDQQELRDHLEAKLKSAEAANEAIKNISQAVLIVRQQIQSQIAALSVAADRAGQLKCTDIQNALRNEVERLEQINTTLGTATNSDEEMISAIEVLQNCWIEDSEEAISACETLVQAIEKLPDISEADKAEELLILAQERYELWVQAVTDARNAASHADIAGAAKATFDEVSLKELNGIYESVQNNFASYYKQLNKGDEENFEGALTPGPAKLNLDVDFYGRGKFPPGAFHSEGHQDGMGLCLYLALMRQILGDDFRFCVLDDVLMSVDTGHRRQVCHLLQKEFPNTQFVMTTHDRVWLNFMRSENLIVNAVTFGGWTVDTGPLIYNDADMMARVREALEQGDVQTAAGRLRHYLEHVGYLLCDNLRASVPFRADGQFTLNDTLPPALSAIRKRLKEAKAAANSWGKAELEEAIGQTLSEFEKAHAQCNVEAWGVNPAVHFNAWENFEPKEFKTIVDAFDEVLAQVRCKTCGSLLRLTYAGPAPQSLNCVCGDLRYDLIKKKVGS
ncbi:AAA family ATPase [Roseibium sp.]|uniref:AAA family ATPase n=1 Tax=Roseibium sp. TaxID=1936156 RepID=UPI003B52EFFE